MPFDATSPQTDPTTQTDAQTQVGVIVRLIPAGYVPGQRKLRATLALLPDPRPNPPGGSFALADWPKEIDRRLSGLSVLATHPGTVAPEALTGTIKVRTADPDDDATRLWQALIAPDLAGYPLTDDDTKLAQILRTYPDYPSLPWAVDDARTAETKPWALLSKAISDSLGIETGRRSDKYRVPESPLHPETPSPDVIAAARTGAATLVHHADSLRLVDAMIRKTPGGTRFGLGWRLAGRPWVTPQEASKFEPSGLADFSDLSWTGTAALFGSMRGLGRDDDHVMAGVAARGTGEHRPSKFTDSDQNPRQQRGHYNQYIPPRIAPRVSDQLRRAVGDGVSALRANAKQRFMARQRRASAVERAYLGGPGRPRLPSRLATAPR